jgi:acyl-coenzyme A thioesterase PaaI-like protein
MNIGKMIGAARTTSWGLWKLNFVLLRGVPFNRPHSIRLIKVDADEVQARIPYKRKNLNHIKGIHACGLATACEYTSGFLLLSELGVKKYRVIMESLEMKYHYQAKKAAIATFKLSAEELKATVIDPLEKEDSIYLRCEINCHDEDGNHLCTGHTNWQVKRWDKVKTKV